MIKKHVDVTLIDSLNELAMGSTQATETKVSSRDVHVLTARCPHSLFVLVCPNERFLFVEKL